ncbi:hypothetical protein Tco_1109080 [Tanacetum coccineum]
MAWMGRNADIKDGALVNQLAPQSFYSAAYRILGVLQKEVGTPRYLSLVVPLTKVGDEAVLKELGDRMERAATTASS